MIKSSAILEFSENRNVIMVNMVQKNAVKPLQVIIINNWLKNHGSGSSTFNVCPYIKAVENKDAVPV